jgi:hypothetical protein
MSNTLPQGCIGRTTEEDIFCSWPLRSPDLTPFHLYSWGWMKVALFVPSLDTNFSDLERRITEAVISFTRDRLKTICEETECRIGVCWRLEGLISITCRVHRKLSKIFYGSVYASPIINTYLNFCVVWEFCLYLNVTIFLQNIYNKISIVLEFLYFLV